MRKCIFYPSPAIFTGLIMLTGVLVVFSLIQVLFTLVGLAYWQKFQIISPEYIFEAHSEPQHQVARKLLQEAIRYDQNHPGYAAQLGSYLLDSALIDQGFEERERVLFEAERWLKHAIMLDPENQWNYYQLGRLYQQRDACGEITRPEDITDCPAAQFFLLALLLLLSALQNTDKQKFLRRREQQE